MLRVAPSDAGRARGAAIGVFFLAGFGSCWLWLGMANTGRDTGAGALLIGLPMLAMVALASRLVTQAGRLPQPTFERSTARFFWLVNAVQWIAIGVAAVGLAARGMADAIPAAVAAIVGLHFFPLAWLFRAPVEYATGAAMLVVAALFREHFVPVLFLSGSILWATALWQLGASMRALYRAEKSVLVRGQA